MNEELTSRAAPSSQAIAACGQQKGLPRSHTRFLRGSPVAARRRGDARASSWSSIRLLRARRAHEAAQKLAS